MPYNNTQKEKNLKSASRSMTPSKVPYLGYLKFETFITLTNLFKKWWNFQDILIYTLSIHPHSEKYHILNIYVQLEPYFDFWTLVYTKCHLDTLTKIFWFLFLFICIAYSKTFPTRYKTLHLDKIGLIYVQKTEKVQKFV